MADTRVMRWRAWLAIAAAIIVAGWWLYTGGPGYVLQIDYQWLGEFVDSAEVVLDGEVVAVLEYDPRARPLRGWEVEAGRHVVELRTRRCSSRPDTVELGETRMAILVADLDESFSGRCHVFFR